MQSKYTYTHSLVEERMFVFLITGTTVLQVFSFYSSSANPSNQDWLILVGQLLLLLISCLYAYRPTKRFSDRIAKKKIKTVSHGWRGRSFFYHLITERKLNLLVTKEVYAMLQEGDLVDGVYRRIDKHVLRLNSDLPVNRQYEDGMVELYQEQFRLVSSKRLQTLFFLLLFIALLIYAFLTNQVG